MSDHQKRIEIELEKARKQLLDLSHGNRLLNFRSTKRSTIRIIHELPEEVFGQLVLDQSQMRFKAAPESAVEGGRVLEQRIAFEEEHTTDRYLQTNLLKDNLSQSLVQIKQKADTVFEEQGYNVLYLALGFLKWKETDSELVIRSAPLILVPVRLERPTVAGHHRVEWTEEDLATNISLQAKLGEMDIKLPEFEIPEDRSGIVQYFDRVRHAIKDRKEWEVVPDIYLGFFSFTKFVMYKDLTPKDDVQKSKVLGSSLLRSIFIGENGDLGGDGTCSGESPREEDEVAGISIRDQIHVLDADSSQVAVIEAVKKGLNLVVEGPPGTGKSQTITNIIAELLAQNKKILFVSEKMAALEVVKKRLENSGLQDSCLELHSRHTNKRAFLDEISRTLNVRPPAPSRDGRTVEDREDIAAELNQYTEILRRPIGTIQRTPFSLFAQYLRSRQQIEASGGKLWLSKINDVVNLTNQSHAYAIRCLKSFGEVLPVLRPISENPWRYCRPGGVLFDSEREEIDAMLNMASEDVEDLQTAIFNLHKQFGIFPPSSFTEIQHIQEVSDCLSKAPNIEASILLSDRWNSISPKAEELIAKLDRIQSSIAEIEGRWDLCFRARDVQELKNAFTKCSKLMETFRSTHGQLELLSDCYAAESIVKARITISASRIVASGYAVSSEILGNSNWNSQNPEAAFLIDDLEFLVKEAKNLKSILTPIAFKESAEDLHISLSLYNTSPFRFLKPHYWKLRRLALSLHLLKPSFAVALANLGKLAEFQKRKSHIKSKADQAIEYYGELWKGEDSNIHLLKDFSKWIIKFRQNIANEVLGERAISIVSAQTDIDQLKLAIDKAETQLSALENEFSNLTRIIGVSLIGTDQGAIETVAFNHIDETLIHWVADLELLESWLHWRECEGGKSIYNLSEQLYRRPSRTEELLSGFEEMRRCLSDVEWIEKRESDAVTYYGKAWQGYKSSVLDLKSLGAWAVEFRKHFKDGSFSPLSASVVEKGVQPDLIAQATDSVTTKSEEAESSLRALAQKLGFSPPSSLGSTWSDISYADWKVTLDSWRNHLHLLSRWVQYVSIREELEKTYAKALIDPIEKGIIEVDHAISTFEANVAESLLRLAFAQHPTLRQFIAEAHERKIQEFARLDSELQKLNRQKIARQMYSGRPKINNLSSAGHESSAGILLGEMNKKKRHMAIRKLMAITGDLIQSIKPCFMMSPLSIAQFLEPNSVSFDVVIFDEASQVRPEDALGALMRGRQLVVMGDTKQLPPTSFFDKIDYDDEEDDDDNGSASIKDVESILHQCQRSFPKKTLRWHYRSRHESLIAISNEQFYQNQLLIYPSIAANVPELGLEFRLSEGSVYDRGKTSQNRVEARIVVDAAIEHFRSNPNKSLGIGTFSAKQQQAILDELEHRLAENPEMQEFFEGKRTEYCFIKNLETIQGDERDIIFVSMGYGKGTDGRVLNNFGPINKEGGSRRLNVLMTRARERCVIFSNFGPEDMSLDENAPAGVRALKRFLDYARYRNSAPTDETLADTDSPFEDFVKDFLQSNGHEVRSQVGCAGFRIDLAIVDPESPGRYLLAVECDGSKYHTSAVTRDRDRLRQQVLESMGWKNRIHRIWSTDWFHNYALATVRLLKAVETAKALKEPANLVPEHVSATSNAGEPIERTDHPSVFQADEFDAEPYRECNDLGVRLPAELHEASPSVLAKGIERIVKVEAPIHYEELVRRIRELHGIGRAGNRIREIIDASTKHAVATGLIRKKGDFLWSAENGVLRPRRRPESVMSFEFIAKEEYEEAIKLVLRSQFATDEKNLAADAARLLGFQRVSEDIARHIGRILKGMLRSQVLVRNAHDMIDLAK